MGRSMRSIGRGVRLLHLSILLKIVMMGQGIFSCHTLPALYTDPPSETVNRTMRGTFPTREEKMSPSPLDRAPLSVYWTKRAKRNKLVRMMKRESGSYYDLKIC